MTRVLALKADGSGFSYCTAPPEKRGMGKCNHMAHQKEGETLQEFIDRVSTKHQISDYKMDSEEKEELMLIRGRKDLENEDCKGGYIEVENPVWNRADIKKFASMGCIKSSEITGLIKKQVFLDPEDLHILKKKELAQRDEEAKEQGLKEKQFGTFRRITGVEALNKFAEAHGYEATKSIYVLPYYMRQDTEEVKNPLNVLYNAIIVSKNKGQDKIQECYSRLLDNKNVEKTFGYKPLTKHGGYAVDSLAELFNGKRGLFRGYLTGFSIPYAGRCVLAPNIRMKFEEVGVPGKMAVDVLEPSILSALEEKGIPEDKGRKWLKKFRDKKAEEIDYRRLDKLMSDNQMRVLVNRAPSLHNPSAQCMNARLSEVVDGNFTGATEGPRTTAKGIGAPIKFSSSPDKVVDQLQMNPMFAKAYNFDCDGDQMAVFGINDPEISELAWEEMNPFHKLNRYNPKSQKDSLIKPTKDALYGLLNILGN